MFECFTSNINIARCGFQDIHGRVSRTCIRVFTSHFCIQPQSTVSRLVCLRRAASTSTPYHSREVLVHKCSDMEVKLGLHFQGEKVDPVHSTRVKRECLICGVCTWDTVCYVFTASQHVDQPDCKGVLHREARTVRSVYVKRCIRDAALT